MCALWLQGRQSNLEMLAHSDLTRRISEVGGIYLGPVQEKDLAATYNLCDVFVMPTRSIEMFGMAALEAQACGKPVVCSQHGGLPEVISPEEWPVLSGWKRRSARGFACAVASKTLIFIDRRRKRHGPMPCASHGHGSSTSLHNYSGSGRIDLR